MEAIAKIYDRPAFAKAASTPTDRDLEAINRFTSEPLDVSDVYVRKAFIANDAVDRDGDRFTPETLERYSEDLPGRGMHIGHSKDGYAAGKWFDSDVERTTFGDVNGTWLTGRVYIPRPGHEPLISDMKAGLAEHVSIRATCDERVVKKDVKGKTLYRELVAWPRAKGSKAEVISVDVVWFPAQRSAGFAKALEQAYREALGFDSAKPVSVRIGGRLFDLTDPELVRAVRELEGQREELAKALESLGAKELSPKRLKLLLRAGAERRPDLVAPESKPETRERRLRPAVLFRTQ
jgi:hypothetical protein